jgi:small conductance mechanosensitive channel
MYASRARELRDRARERASEGRRRALILAPVIAGVVYLYAHRQGLLGVDLPVRIAAVIALVILGWIFAESLGRAVGPRLFRRLEPGATGTIGFLIRLATLALTVLFALRLAGLRPQTLAVGGAITAVIFGLAAQQTLGNLIAGTVLLSARPFRVGDRVRLQAGGLAGQTEGVVSSLGLLYTSLSSGADRIMVPNSVVLSAAVVPLREPSGVDVRARLKSDVKPSEVQRVIDETVDVPTRFEPDIALEEFDGEELVVRVGAKPVDDEEGPRLADQVLSALGRVARDTEPSRGEGPPAAGAEPRGRTVVRGVSAP